MSNNKRRNNQNREDNNNRIPKDAEKFASITFKKFKKKNDFFDSKKEAKIGYFSYLVTLLPDTLDFVVKNGHIQREEIQNVKKGIYSHITDEDFIKYMGKLLKDDDDHIDNIKLLPIVIKDIIEIADKTNRERLTEDPNAKIYDMSDLVKLSNIILKKRLKKLEKAGVPTDIAFDILSLIPAKSVIKISQTYRISQFFQILYEHAKKEEIPFSTIMEVMFDETYYATFIAFALLERKDKFGKLTEEQQKFYLAISNWCFSTMESIRKEEIRAILKTYVSVRKRDAANGKDSARRYSLRSLSETDYPKITKVINEMIAEDSEISKYL